MVAVRPELPDGSIPLADCRVTAANHLHRSQGPGQPGRSALTTAAALASGSTGDLHRWNATPVGSPPRPIRTRRTSEIPLEPFNPRLTRTGAKLGTGAYMAPEQFRDPGSVDIRADIYAFGVVLFEMITGKLPFKGKSLDMLDRQHAKYDPPSVVPSIPARWRVWPPTSIEIVQRAV